MSTLLQHNDCTISPHFAELPSNDLCWYAVQTRSRHEKMVAAQLGEKQITAFLPLYKEVRRWSDRRKLIEQPLFPGYVFVRVPNEDDVRIMVLRTGGVVRFVGVQGSGTPIPDKQIEGVQSLLNSDVPFGLFPFMCVGRRVRIRGGYLDGVEGVLLAKNSDRSVIVSVDLIQRSLAIRVAGFDLEMI